MCGRYALFGDSASDQMNLLIQLCNQNANSEEQITPGNLGEVCPGENAPGLILDRMRVRAVPMRWGFSGKNQTFVIHARSENLSDRPMFSRLMHRNRCVLPAASYFEWRRGDGQKYQVTPESNCALYLAGLYRRDENGFAHFVVLTRQAFGIHAEIHSRMPVTLQSRDEARRWLRGELSINDLIGNENLPLHASALGPEQMTIQFEAQPDGKE